jgi:predicted O-methyltransferase YrrM
MKRSLLFELEKEIEEPLHSSSITNVNDPKIRAVLDQLEKRIEYEHLHDDIPLEERTLAITAGTGSFYNLMLKLMNAKNILEIGTSVGYSTLWFADALKSGKNRNESIDARIITVERNRHKVVQAAKNFSEAGVENFIEIREGIAQVILTELRSTPSHREYFDFVYIDADKENAIEYFKQVFPLTRTGGMIAADNLYQPADCIDPMSRYSKYIRTRTDVQTTSVPIGNGQELSLKLSS